MEYIDGVQGRLRRSSPEPPFPGDTVPNVVTVLGMEGGGSHGHAVVASDSGEILGVGKIADSTNWAAWLTFSTPSEPRFWKLSRSLSTDHHQGADKCN